MGPGVIAIDTDDELAQLVVETGIAAPKPTAAMDRVLHEPRREIYGPVSSVRSIGDLIVKPAAARLCTNIKAGPTERNWRIGRCLGRHVSGGSRIDETECGNGRNRCDKLFHETPS